MPHPPLTLLMTRPRDAAERFVKGLSPDLLRVLTPEYAPLMKIEPIPTRPDLTGRAGVIFTSANGVVAASGLTDDRSLPAHCVGEATAHTARELGWHTQIGGENADALVARLVESRCEGPLLHLCGKHTRGKVAERLSDAGCPTLRWPVYNQTLLPLEERAQRILEGATPVIAPIFSPRTARQFVSQCGNARNLDLVALSPAVAKPLSSIAHFAISVAKRPDAAGMAEEIEKLTQRLCRVESGEGAQ